MDWAGWQQGVLFSIGRECPAHFDPAHAVQHCAMALSHTTRFRLLGARIEYSTAWVEGGSRRGPAVKCGHDRTIRPAHTSFTLPTPAVPPWVTGKLWAHAND